MSYGVGQVTDSAWILCCCGCGVGQQPQLRLDPSLGTSICLGFHPKKRPKNKKFKKKIKVLLFSFLAAPQHMAFPGQGSDPSLHCNVRHSCGNTKSLPHCACPEINPIPLCHSRNSKSNIFHFQVEVDDEFRSQSLSTNNSYNGLKKKSTNK